VRDTLDAPTLDAAQVSSWLGVVNDLRLVLGTRLDVTEEMERVALDDPRAPALAVYQYLTYLLSEIVQALSDTL